MAIQQATSNDIPSLVSLLNSAYRGDASKKGWTTEADLLEGEERTDSSVLSNLIQTPQTVFLKYTGENGAVEGCVFHQKMDNKLYPGMLSVSGKLPLKVLVIPAHFY